LGRTPILRVRPTRAERAGALAAGSACGAAWRIAITLSLLCAAPIASAAPATADVFDTPLRQVLNRDAPKLVLYTNPNTRESVNDAGPILKEHLKGISYITIVHVDLRGIPSFLLSISRKLMQRSQTEVNERDAELMAAAGIKPKPEETDLLHVVMEPDGEAHQLLGLARDFQQGIAVVLDRAGHEVLRTQFPQNGAAVEKALRDAARTPLQPQGRKSPASAG
jgi:hypothetical protein